MNYDLYFLVLKKVKSRAEIDNWKDICMKMVGVPISSYLFLHVLYLMCVNILDYLTKRSLSIRCTKDNLLLCTKLFFINILISFITSKIKKQIIIIISFIISINLL